MRKGLKNLNNKRLRFSADIERFGSKTAFKGPPIPTILLKNVTRSDTKEVVADHLWFTMGKSWGMAAVGGKVEFDARVSLYEKGYKGHREDVLDNPVSTDYRLERPTKLRFFED